MSPMTQTDRGAQREAPTAVTAVAGAVVAAVTALTAASFALPAAAQEATQFVPVLSYRTGPYAPSGIPVATVALNGAKNAAWLAAEILALGDEALAAKLDAERVAMARQIAAKEEKLQKEIEEL